MGVPRLPTAVPAAPEAPPQRESYWGDHTFSRVLFSGAPRLLDVATGRVWDSFVLLPRIWDVGGLLRALSSPGG